MMEKKKGGGHMKRKEAPDGAIYHQLARCLSILRRLERAELHIDYLAEQYGCSTRTILRDLTVLTVAGHPILPTGRKGWYRLER